MQPGMAQPQTAQPRTVWISGGTGYMGRSLAKTLIARGWKVRILARPGSEKKVPAGAEAVSANALRSETFSGLVGRGETFIHLTGASHPAPWKEREFREIDLVSLRASVEAAESAGVGHFVYVSVAQPAPVMRAYIEVRRECEGLLESAGLRRTILRPWYVLGPGHRWPVALKPVYAALEAIPYTRDSARRLGLVTLGQMTRALAWSVENQPEQVQILDVPDIRRLGQ